MNIYNKVKFQRKFQKKASYFGINEGLKNMNLLKNPSGIDEFLNESNKSEFHMLRSKTNYNSAYIQELNNLNNYIIVYVVKGSLIPFIFSVKDLFPSPK